MSSYKSFPQQHDHRIWKQLSIDIELVVQERKVRSDIADEMGEIHFAF